jgi:hypothetical protein
MVTPQMPTRLAIGQTIFDNDSYGKFDNCVRIMRMRPGDVPGVRAEVFFTSATIMNRRNKLDIDRTPRTRITKMMQPASPQIMPPRRIPAIGTRTFFEVLTALFELGLRQIGRVCDPRRDIRDILTSCGHGNFLRE